MVSLLLIALHLVAFSVHNTLGQAIQGSPERQNDVQLLLMLKNSIENWPAFAAANRISGWEPNVPVCLWTGVSCTDTGDIISVALQCRGACPVQAHGTLPQDIARMSNLETLNLEGQALRGPLPSSWFEADAWSGLRNLFLSGNPLGGTLPETQPGALRDLSQLRLSNCSLEGPLPGSWGRDETSMRHLNVLRMDRNRLNGTLPEDWGTAAAFPEIATLDLSSNRLSGQLPALWADPRAVQFLQELFLGGNGFNGGLPPGFGRPDALHELRYLDLSMNPLGGQMPAEWVQPGSFPLLRSLDFNDTGISGQIPASFPLAFPVLDVLRVPNNNLSGPLPPSFQNFSALDRLVLKPGNPLLCGTLPPNLPFQVCDDRDVTCMRLPVELLPECPAGLPPATDIVLPAAAVAPAPSVPPAPAVSEPSDGGGGTNIDAIVGGAVGGAVAAIAVGVLLAVALRRRRRQRGRVTAIKSSTLPSVRPFFSEEEAAAGAGRAAPVPAAAAAAAAVPAAAAAPASAFEVPDIEKGLKNGVPEVPLARKSSNGMVSPFQQPLGAFTEGWGARSEVPTPSVRSTPRRLASLLSSLQASRSSTSTPPPGPYTAATLPPTLPESPDNSGTGIAGREYGSSEFLPPRRSTASFGTFSLEEEQNDSLEAEGSSGACAGGSPPDMTAAAASPGAPPWDECEVGLTELEVCLRPDGSEWVIGSGGFGRVYKALRSGVQPVAVKVIPAPPPGGTGRDHTKHEIAILKACRDANIVQFQGAYLGPSETLLITEFMDGGDLQNNIAKGRVTWWRRGRRIAIDVAKALAYLHRRKIVHFDVKSSNVLLARDGTAKLGDVGMARFMAQDYVTGVVATLAWAAPEMLWGARCTENADIYSYGIVLWEICTGDVPERGRLRDIVVPEEAPQEVQDLVLECLDSRPSERPSALQIVERLQALSRTARTPGAAAAAPAMASTSEEGSGERRSSLERATAAGDAPDAPVVVVAVPPPEGPAAH